MNSRGQFSIIAALLVAIVLAGTLMAVYSTIRYDSSQTQPPQILTATDETNSALAKTLGFTVGYYGSILQVTGNQTYAYTNATIYMSSALQYIANMNPTWGASFNITKLSLSTNWFSNPSMSTGNLSVVYDLAGLGIYGTLFTTSCSLAVQIYNSPNNNQVCLNVTQDLTEPLTSLGQQNFAFYYYNYSTSSWQFVNSVLAPVVFTNGTYLINYPSGIDPSAYMVQVTDSRGIMVEASSFNSYNMKFTFGQFSQNSPTIVELMQNGTMTWFGQDLTNVSQIRPIPPIPLKSLHLCQTGYTTDLPYQVEDWASQYQIPLGLSSNYTIFSNTQMIVFEVSPSISQLTLWWNGSDTANQPSAAFTSTCFTSDKSYDGFLSNGNITLQFSLDGNNNSYPPLTSSIGTVSSTANFMRIDDHVGGYGSGLAYVIQHGVVRDIVQGETEWSGDSLLPNCPNVYTQLVFTLPANATYYTYQLRLIFINSASSRNINDISPIQLSTSVSQPQALTENGTASGIPIVAYGTGIFNNSAGNAHHWSELINNGLQGTGIMFTDIANQQLYAFDSLANKFTGALNVSSSAPYIELDPVTAAGPVSFSYPLDLTWYGIVATFNGVNPIYASSGNSGLWSVAEQPPSVTVAPQSSSAATINVSPSSDPVGFTVPVSGGGFVPNSPITITFNGNTVATTTAGPYGDIPLGTSFVVPSGSFGTYVITASDMSSNSASVNFTIIPNPMETITLQPNGISSDAGSQTILTIDSVPYTYSTLPASFTWQAGTSHTITASSAVGAGSGKQYAWLSWSDGGTQTQSYIVPFSSATVTANFNTQYQVTFNYGVSGGGSGYSASPVTYYQSGSQSSIAAGPSATVWIDSGSTYTYTNNPLPGSSASERWFASTGTSGTISSSGTFNPTYYNEYSVTFGYSDQDSTAITSVNPIGAYYQLGSLLTINSGSSYGVTSPVSDWVDGGSGKVNYQTFTSSSGNQRWALSSSPASFAVSSSATISESSFYHQYQFTASYSTKDSSTPSANVILSGTQFGSSSYTFTLTKSTQNTWLDANTGWSVNNPIASGTQRWDATSGTSGTVTGAVTIAPSYYDQYQVTPYYAVSDSSSPTVANVVSFTQFGGGASATPTKGSSGGSAVWVDAGSAVTYNSPIAGSGERWQVASVDSGTYTALSLVSSSTTVTVLYYDQYQVTPYYAVSDSSSPTVANVVSFTQFGGGASATPTKGSSGGSAVWVDAGSAVTYTSPINGASERWQVSSSDSTTHTAISSVTSSTTTTLAYYDQYQVSAKYSTSDGTTPSSSVTLSGIQFGSALPTTNLGTNSQNVWLDSGTGWSVTNPVTSGSQRWDAASGTSGTIAGATTVAPSYYHQYSHTLSYVVVDGGSPSAPIATGTSLGSAYAPSLTTSASPYWFDASGSITFSTSTGTNEQWAPNPSSVSATSANSQVVSMYNQYKVTASYGVPDGSTPSGVILSGTQLGSSGYTLPLTKVAQTTWLDATTAWSVTNPVTSGSQRWDAASGTSGTIAGATTVAPSYYHQYSHTLSYVVVDGGSPSAPIATGTSLGSAYAPSLTTSASPYWFDASGSIAISTSTSGSNEQWAPNPATISAASANTQVVSMYNQYKQILSYSVVGSDSPGTAPTATGSSLGVAYAPSLTTSASTYWFDASGSVAFSTPTGTNEQWVPKPSSVSATQTNTQVVSLYDQYSQTLSYVVVDGGSPSAPIATGTSLGSAYAPSLTTSASPYWFDASGSIAISTPTATNEQWVPNPVSISAASSHSQVLSMYNQYKHTLSYVVVDGGSPSAPIATGTSLGSAYAPSLTTSASPYWFDASGSITFSTSTGTNEQWAPNPSSVSATSANSQVVSMYNQYKVTASYGVPDGSTPSGVILSGTQLGSSGYTLPLTKVAQTTWLDATTAWSVTNPVTSGSQRWDAASGTSGTIAGATTVAPSYYHQYQVTFNYAVSGGGSGYSAPSVTYYQFGSQLSVTASSSSTVWTDSGSTYTYTNNPLSGSNSNEQWYASSGTSGTVSSSTTITPTYNHQYYVTMATPSHGSVTPPPPGEWVNAGTGITITATGQGSHTFNHWSSNTGNITFTSSTSSTTTATINGYGTITGNFN